MYHCANPLLVRMGRDDLGIPERGVAKNQSTKGWKCDLEGAVGGDHGPRRCTGQEGHSRGGPRLA